MKTDHSQDKRAIVLGASSGIGKALAIYLSGQGYKVAIAARRGYLLKPIVRQYPNIIAFRQINVCRREQAIKRVHELKEMLGGLDLFVYCSAVGHQNQDLNWEIEKETAEINVEGFTALITAAYKLFKKQGGGHLVNISSIAGTRGNRFAPGYCSSKAYQIAYLQSLRHMSVKNKHNITITDIRPGFVDTPMAQGDHVFWAASPAKAALQIYKAIRQKKAFAYITKRWAIVARLIQWLPSFIYNRV